MCLRVCIRVLMYASFYAFARMITVFWFFVRESVKVRVLSVNISPKCVFVFVSVCLYDCLFVHMIMYRVFLYVCPYLWPLLSVRVYCAMRE